MMESATKARGIRGMNRFAEIEAQLRSVLAGIGQYTSTSDVEEVSEYLDVGEYGLALRTICELLTEKGSAIPSRLYQLISDIGCRMQMDSGIWEQLRTRIEG
jgi:hypothetical protein